MGLAARCHIPGTAAGSIALPGGLFWALHPHAVPSSPLTGSAFLGLPAANQWDVRLGMQIGNGSESLQEDESEGKSLMGGGRGTKLHQAICRGSGEPSLGKGKSHRKRQYQKRSKCFLSIPAWGGADRQVRDQKRD